MKFTEQQLISYSAPISETEEERCKNAIKMVRDAMKLVGYTDDNKEIRKYEADTFSYLLEMRSSDSKNLTLLVQGSYANNTNIRAQSDVDVAVILESTFIPEYRAGVSGTQYNFSDGTYTAESLKDEVERALSAKFSQRDVQRGNKSIKVHGNSYRVDADVVPCYRLRDYRGDFNFSASNYVGGIEIRPDSGSRIRNYPEQHIKNGRSKNNATNYYFKKHVRIMKKLRSLMEDSGYSSAEKMSSFGIESLLWNVPNEKFMLYSSYRFTFDELIGYLYSNQSTVCTFKEINGIKSMFEDNPGSLSNCLSFINDLKSYFQYDI